MKKLSLLTLGIVSFGLLVFSYTRTISFGSNRNVESNFQAMQASAGTYSCDQSNANCCSYPGMNSNGVLKYVTAQ